MMFLDPPLKLKQLSKDLNFVYSNNILFEVLIIWDNVDHVTKGYVCDPWTLVTTAEEW